MDDVELPLVLGPVVFLGFELPDQIPVGGTQRLAIHRLADGSRVIDVLGPDAHDIAWHGVLSGPLAFDRARALDGLRVDGAPLALLFGEWFGTVLVRGFTADLSMTGWIPYRITCTVVETPEPADPVLIGLSNLAAPLAGDVGSPGLESSGLESSGLGSSDLATVVAAAGLLAAAQVSA